MPINVTRSNDIKDLPPLGKETHSTFIEEADITKEKEVHHNKREADFRRWLVKNKPSNSVMVPIETSTATGVPDIFACYNGCSIWVECKVETTGMAKLRGTQYTFFKQLINAGGQGRLAIQRIGFHTGKPASIDIYDVADIVALPLSMLRPQGAHLLIPTSLPPKYKWYYNINKKEMTSYDLYMNLLLDTQETT